MGIEIHKKTDENDFIHIINTGPEGGSSSYVGRAGGKQVMKIAEWASKGTVIHEFLHALGFWHEHSRGDRDSFVEIHYDNIQDGKAHNFTKHTTDGKYIFGYDFGSIMHYPAKAFSKNGKDTIKVIEGSHTIGQRKKLSVQDELGLIKKYLLNGNEKKLYLMELHCSETEDSTGPDEIYFKVKPDDEDEYKVNMGDIHINNGNTQRLNLAPISIDKKIKLRMMERDTQRFFDKDDCLGDHLLFDAGDTEQNHEVNKVYKKKYKDDGSNYTLTYAVLSN